MWLYGPGGLRTGFFSASWCRPITLGRSRHKGDMSGISESHHKPRLAIYEFIFGVCWWEFSAKVIGVISESRKEITGSIYSIECNSSGGLHSVPIDYRLLTAFSILPPQRCAHHPPPWPPHPTPSSRKSLPRPHSSMSSGCRAQSPQRSTTPRRSSGI